MAEFYPSHPGHADDEKPMLGPTSILPYVIDIPYLRLADGCLAWVTNETLPGLFDYQYLDGEEKYRFAFSEQNAAFQFKMRWL